MSQHPQSAAAGRAPAPSQTITQTNGQEGTSSDTVTAAPRILRLRGRHEPDGRTVQWAEDVVDNEGLGRKSSKVCCIYHKPKAVGESSDESSSDSDSSTDSEDGSKRKAMDADRSRDAMRGRRKGHGHGDKGKRKPSPNAYEKVPKNQSKGKEKDEGGQPPMAS
ncbi:hypothetical protein CC79DRAFT_1335860 [Sarocladium strictum]